MREDTERKVILNLGDVQHLYWTLDASRHEFDEDDIVDILIAQRRAFQILSQVPGLTLIRGWEATEASADTIWADRNPLLSERSPGPDDLPADDPITSVVYGDAGGWFAFLDAANAAVLVEELEALRGCSTLGELRALALDLTLVEPPIRVDEDDYPFRPDTEPINLFESGEWPPRATAYAVDLLPLEVQADLAEHAGAEFVDEIVGGPLLWVPVDREPDVLTVLARHGITARRDDDLIGGLE